MSKGGTKLMFNTGSEGPKYDPYHYEELTVVRNGKMVTLHLGLGDWLEVDGKKVSKYEYGGEGMSPEEKFEILTGMNTDEFMKYYQVIHNTCKKCGCRDNYPMSGFPGETFNVCAKCGEIVSSDFNMGAIM